MSIFARAASARPLARNSLALYVRTRPVTIILLADRWSPPVLLLGQLEVGLGGRESLLALLFFLIAETFLQPFDQLLGGPRAAANAASLLSTLGP